MLQRAYLVTAEDVHIWPQLSPVRPHKVEINGGFATKFIAHAH